VDIEKLECTEEDAEERNYRIKYLQNLKGNQRNLKKES